MQEEEEMGAWRRVSHLMLPPGSSRSIGTAVGSAVVQPRQKMEVLERHLRSADSQLLRQLPYSCPLASLDCSTRHISWSINLPPPPPKKTCWVAIQRRTSKGGVTSKEGGGFCSMECKQHERGRLT